jgi:hypothetical protein
MKSEQMFLVKRLQACEPVPAPATVNDRIFFNQCPERAGSFVVSMTKPP